ncbi:hypothetical protein FACS1894111_06530 [Clostridia bacterium]|nr:hypothetical protein FACS1894111_06530 [Clostridia bacterium]
MVSAFGLSLSDVTDGLVVGQRMSSVGFAALSLMLPVYAINNIFVHGLGVGGSVRYSTLLGQGKPQEAKDSFNHVMQFACLLGLATALLGNLFLPTLLHLLGTVPGDGELYRFTAVYLRIFLAATPLYYFANLLNYYLRNDDNGKLAGIGSVTGTLFEVSLCVIFVLVMDMGTAGAAYAYAAGQMAALVVYARGILDKSNTLKIKKTVPSLSAAIRAFCNGFSSSVNYLFLLIFILISNNFLVRTGGEAAVAVFGMIQSASYLIYYLYEGTVRAMQPIISTYHGEHREEGKRTAIQLSFCYGGIVGITTAVLAFVFAKQMFVVMGLTEPEVTVMGVFALRLFCVGTVFAGISIIVSGYYQSCEKEKYSFFIQALRGGFVLLPLTVLFAFLGADMFWWVFPVTEGLSLFIWGITLMIRLKFPREGAFDPQRVWNGSMFGGHHDITELTTSAEEFCERWGANPKQTYFVSMAIEEVCMSIWYNGFEQTGSEKKGVIEITVIAQQEGQFSLHIRDNAALFNPFELNTQKASPNGDYDMDAMGIFVIKQKSSFFYRRYGGFNTMIVKI